MFSLVQFDNGEYLISDSRRVTQTSGRNYVLKYKGGGNYSCTLIMTADTKSSLVSFRDELIRTSNDPKVRCSTPIDRKALPILKIRLSDISKDSLQSTCNTDKSSSRSAIMSTVESSAPSGVTDILNFIGTSWENDSGNLVIDESKLPSSITDELCSGENEVNHLSQSILLQQEKNSPTTLLEKFSENSEIEEKKLLNGSSDKQQKDNNEQSGSSSDKQLHSTSLAEQSYLSNDNTAEIKDSFSNKIRKDNNEESFADEQLQSTLSDEESDMSDDDEADIMNDARTKNQTNNNEESSSNDQSQSTLSDKKSDMSNDNEANILNSSCNKKQNDNNEESSSNEQLQSTLSEDLSHINNSSKADILNCSDHYDKMRCDKDISHKNKSKRSLKQQIFQSEESESDSNSSDDLDYIPETSLNQSKATNGSLNSKNCNNSASFDRGPSIDITNVKILHSRSRNNKRTVKKYFCPYCHEFATKFARHLENKHPTELDVQKFMHYDKQTPAQANIIAKIRKRGIFLHNTKPEFNSGYLLTARLPTKNKRLKKSANDFVCCDHCKDFYSKKTIRIHYSKCNVKHKKGTHSIFQNSKRKAGFMHPSASDFLRRTIFPVLRDNAVTNAIAYDELIIKYGNKLCTRYTHPREYDMIRTKLRYLGKHKIEAKKINKKINDYISLLRPEHIDTVVNALKKVAKWNEKLLKYDSPWVATKMSTLIKKVAKKYRSECIKKMDKTEKESIDNFLLLWEEEVPTLIHRQASEDQVRKRRQKKQELPSKEDIRILYDYLKKICFENKQKLEKRFDVESWKQLMEATLILVQIFNRKRPGDIEALLIDDFKNQETINENINHDIYEKLTTNSKEIVKRYVRITVRGKKNRTVPVLLNTFIVECIDVLLANRSLAGVKEGNKHVFSRLTNNPLQKQWICAYPLLRKFSDKCGAKLPSTLRSTKLRKHIATHTAMVGLQDADIDRLASFMGHQKDIHKNIYRVSIPTAEMTLVANLLESAINKSTNNENDESSDASNSSSSDDTDEDEAGVQSEPSVSCATNDTINPDFNGEDIDTKDDEIDIRTDKSSQKRSRSSSDNSNDEEPDKFNSDVKKPNKKSANRVSFAVNSRKKKKTKICLSDDDHYYNKERQEKISKRNTAPTLRKVSRMEWTNDEIESVHKEFGDLLKLKGLPSLDKCSETIRKYKSLKHRTAEQLKSYIDNQRRKEQRRRNYQLEKLEDY